MPEYKHTHRVAETDDPTTLDLDGLEANTDVILPDGRIELQGQFFKGWGSMRFRAADGASPTLVVPDGTNEFAVSFGGDHLVWDGIDFDISDGITGLRAVCPAFRIEDVTFRGRGTHPGSHLVQCLSVAVTDRDGEGVVRNVTARKGSTWARYKRGKGRTWMWVGPRHVGTLRVDNCDVREFGNNGIYGSAAEGPLIVEDSYFENNNVSGVRFGADGGAVRNTEIVIDPKLYTGPREPFYESHAFHFRGVWVESRVAALNAPGRVRVEESTIHVHGDADGHLPTGAEAINVRPNACAVDINGADIDVTARRAKPIAASAPTGTDHHPPQDPPHDIDLRRTRITDDKPVDALVAAEGRDLSLRDQCCLHATADGVAGVVCEGASIRAFENSIVNVPGDPVRPTDTDISSIDTESPPPVEWPPDDTTTRPPPTDPTTGVPEPGDDIPDSDLLIHFLPTMKLIIKTDGDEQVSYNLYAADGSDISVGSNPDGDDVTDGVASGRIWPGGGDSYELTGALRRVSFSGPGADDAYVEVDGDRVEPYELKSETLARAGEALSANAEAMFKSARSSQSN